MKVLPDECVPRPLKFDLIGHDVDHETLNVMKKILAGQLVEIKI